MYEGFRDDICVEPVAEIDGIDVITMESDLLANLAL